MHIGISDSKREGTYDATLSTDSCECTAEDGSGHTFGSRNLLKLVRNICTFYTAAGHLLRRKLATTFYDSVLFSEWNFRIGFAFDPSRRLRWGTSVCGSILCGLDNGSTRTMWSHDADGIRRAGLVWDSSIACYLLFCRNGCNYWFVPHPSKNIVPQRRGQDDTYTKFLWGYTSCAYDDH